MVFIGALLLLLGIFGLLGLLGLGTTWSVIFLISGGLVLAYVGGVFTSFRR